jgi:hypothetical protein
MDFLHLLYLVEQVMLTKLAEVDQADKELSKEILELLDLQQI